MNFLRNGTKGPRYRKCVLLLELLSQLKLIILW